VRLGRRNPEQRFGPFSYLPPDLSPLSAHVEKQLDCHKLRLNLLQNLGKYPSFHLVSSSTDKGCTVSINIHNLLMQQRLKSVESKSFTLDTKWNVKNNNDMVEEYNWLILIFIFFIIHGTRTRSN